MKNTKFLVLFAAIFAFFEIFAAETPDSETPDSENPDAEVSDAETSDAETSDAEVPDSDSDSETPPAVDNMGHMIGGKPADSWEDGGQDFFVMFNSNVDNKIKLYGETAENPQGDTCVDSSSFTLDSFHIPDDAIIEKAYLIWMGAVDPSKLNMPTDNKVHLAFTQTADKNVEYAADIEAPAAKKLTDAPSFDFEGIRYHYPVTLGCSETEEGHTEPDFEIGYFTYRVDVTDFFNQIYEINKAAEHQEGTGEFYGTYTFSDLDCTDHDAYKCQTTMVSAWSLFFIYRSKHIKPKKIYFYNGLSFVYGEKSDAEVSGFEFGQYPTVRVTTMIAEGDPGLSKKGLPDEEITLLGEQGGKPYKLKNKCNDFASDGHIEVYNSISSIVNWDPNAESDNQIRCVSGLNDEGVNYGIDVDTFLLDSEKEINLQEHLQHVEDPNNPDKQDSITISLSVNQDAIFTNFMVLSLDIKGSSFDIPEEPEKYSCSCPATDGNAQEYYCPYVNTSKEFYYLVKVQNWGGEETGKVTISDELDSQLDYVPGTTEYATKFNDSGDGTDWTVIPDKDGGKFPLSGSGYQLAEKMQTCREEGTKKVCSDKILVRYRVKPKKGIAKNYVFTNIAVLQDSKSETPYKTNTSYPLKLKPVNCVPDAQCSSPTPEMCGGVRDEKECTEDKDCPNGYTCKNSKCEDNLDLVCSGAKAEIAIGQNSPQSDNSTIIMKDNGGRPLVVGQFTVQATDCEEGKYINFDDLRVHFDTKNDANFEFSEYELIYDANGNGTYDEDIDTIVSDASATEENNKYVYFHLLTSEKKFKGKDLNNFIVRVKVNYKGENITSGTSFQFLLESGEVATINGKADSTLVTEKNETQLKFAKFFLEPTGDYFIATIGPNDPPVPPIAQINNNIPVMQIRTKSIGMENSIDRIRIKVPNTAVKFGDKNGITGISVWVDTNNDGKGDQKVAEKTSFKAGEANLITFEKEDFTETIKYAKDEEKYIVINVDFNMAKAEPAMVGKIIVSNFKLSNSSATVYDGNPINSKTFTYACKDGDQNCQQQSDSKSGGCAVLEVESNNTNLIVIAAVLSVAAMLGFALLRKKLF